MREYRLKLKSRAFLKRNTEKPPHVNSEMLEFAGKTVTVKNLRKLAEHNLCDVIGGDPWEWADWMFVKFPRIPKPFKLGSHEVEFKSDGSIEVGCTKVKFSEIKKIYNKSIKLREKKGKKK